jgi:hypothetical protein
MSTPAGQRRTLAKTENALRASDPDLASILDGFGWLNRDEQMPGTEQLPPRGRIRLPLLRGLTARRDPRARSFAQYAAIWFCVLVVAAWVSWIVMAGASVHSASCPTAPMVNAATHGANVTACKLTVEKRFPMVVLSATGETVPKHSAQTPDKARALVAVPGGGPAGYRIRARQLVKMSSGQNADTSMFGASTTWLTFRSTATLHMA